MLDVVARCVKVSVHHHPHYQGQRTRDGHLLCAHQRDRAKVKGACRGGREVADNVLRTREKNGNQGVRVERIGLEHRRDQFLGPLVKMVSFICGQRGGAANSPDCHAPIVSGGYVRATRARPSMRPQRPPSIPCLDVVELLLLALNIALSSRKSHFQSRTLPCREDFECDVPAPVRPVHDVDVAESNCLDSLGGQCCVTGDVTFALFEVAVKSRAV